MSEHDSRLSEQARECAERLLQGGFRLVVAESCTGGWLAKVLTDLPGSSQWFDRGYVTYSNQAKQEMLGVPSEILERWGAVSEQTVEAMVSGALERVGRIWRSRSVVLPVPLGGLRKNRWARSVSPG